MLQSGLFQHLTSYVEAHEEELVSLVRDLVRIPSENKAPHGRELGCQMFISEHLRASGCDVEVYRLDEVSGLAEHPLFWPARDYTDRPNVCAVRAGAGNGRSLILSGHIDTVPAGTQPWTRDPFGGEVIENRLYGRGSNDMKAGVATNLFVMRALDRLGIKLKGHLIAESVVDEEFGGVNGTLAGRVKGYRADAAVLSEPSFLRVCPAQRGGRTAHITLSLPPGGGILTDKDFPAGISASVARFLGAIPAFAELRRSQAPAHPMYSRDPVPVAVTKIVTGPWGTGEPVSSPETCQIEMYWQAMPGETQAEVDGHFRQWLESVTAATPHLFPVPPKLEFPIRWLPGSALPANAVLPQKFAVCAERVLGTAPVVAGIEGPCDLFVFHEFGIPAVLWGARGGNTHNADEFVEIDSVVKAATALLEFVCEWCEVME